MFCGLEKQQKKNPTSWERQTSKNFSFVHANSRTSGSETHKGGKAAASGEGTEGAGLQLLQEASFRSVTNPKRGL